MDNMELMDEVQMNGEAAVIETEGAQVADGFNNKKFVDSPLSSSSFFPQAFMTCSAMAFASLASATLTLTLSTLRPKASIGDQGAIAIFADSEGNVVGLHSLVN